MILQIQKWGLWLLLLMPLTFVACSEEEDECEKTDLEESINLDFFAWGNVNIVDGINGSINHLYVDGEPTILVDYFKVHCDGHASFKYRNSYAVLNDGTLDKLELGHYTFGMSNTKEYMQIEIWFRDKLKQGQEFLLHTEQIRYTQWQFMEDIRAEMSLQIEVSEPTPQCNCSINFLN